MNAFIEHLMERARASKKTIVLAEAGIDARTAKAAALVLKEDIVHLILIGDGEKIRSMADGDISKATIINPETYEKKDELTKQLYEMRKSKGVTMEKAAAMIQDPLYLGVMLVHNGIADGMVAGAYNATAKVIRPSLQILKTAPGVKLVSAFFVMVVPDCEYGENGVFVFSDCGLNQEPNAEELAHIAISASKTFRLLVEAEPNVAMLSHSTKGSASHRDITKVVEATELVHQMAPSLRLDGELQSDAAIVPEIADSKAPGSEVAGKANVLIFPNLDAGNIAYKLVQRLGKVDAYGPVLQGLPKPVNDLSRGCSVEDIIGVIAITAVQAQVSV